jgi:hypothetical protein
MKTYTTRSNARRAAQALAKKYAIITETFGVPSDSNEAFIPQVLVNCAKSEVPVELFKVAVVDPQDPSAWEAEAAAAEMALDIAAQAAETLEAPAEAAVQAAEVAFEAGASDDEIQQAAVQAAEMAYEAEENDCRREVQFNAAGDPIDPLKVPVIGEFSHCPSCGIHLDNGYQTDFNMRADGYEGNKKYEYICLGCTAEFGPEIYREAKPVSAGSKPKLNKSAIERPCKAVWDIAERMHNANPETKRRDVLIQCEKEGIAYYTARTQYQQWLTVCKEMREREATQAAKK